MENKTFIEWLKFINEGSEYWKFYNYCAYNNLLLKTNENISNNSVN